MVDIEKIKGLSFQKRLVEAFKVIRKGGVKARLGPAWDAERKLMREPHWCMMYQWEYAPMNNYGRTRGNLQCDSPATAEKVLEVVKNFGISAELNRNNRNVVHLSGTDDSLIGKTELEAAMKNLTRELLVETYSLD
jgi:hypothetical protein